MSSRFEFKPIPNRPMAHLEAAYEAERKWFSDAECAAHAWKAEAEYWSALWHYEGDPDFWDRARTVWARFATHPHAHEEP